MHVSTTNNNTQLFYALSSLFLIVFLVYFPALQGAFVSDDLAMIVNNAKNFGDWSKIGSFFTAGVWNHANEPHADGSLYRPLWLFWNLVSYQFAGESPFGWHVSNLVLHATNSLLIYLLAGRLTPQCTPLARFLAAVLFLIHPATSQNAAWISGSTDVLLAFFLLSSLLFYTLYQERKNPVLAIVALASYGSALLTKEAAISFLLVFLVYDMSRLQAWNRPPWKYYVALIIVTSGYLVLRGVALQGVLDGASPWQMDANAIGRFFDYATTYLRVLVAPWPIPITMQHAPQSIATIVDNVAGIALVIGASMLFVRHRASRTALAIILTPLFIPLLLAFHEKGLFAARFLYVPVAGLSLLCVTLIQHSLRQSWSKASSIFILITLAAITAFIEVPHWQNRANLANYMLEYDTSYAGAWNSLAQHHLTLHETDKAIKIYQQSFENVTNLEEKISLMESLALVYANNQRFAESLTVYQQITAEPAFSHIGWTGAGNALWMLKQHQQALQAYRNALNSNPRYFDALYNYAVLNESLNRSQDAAQAYQQLLSLPITTEQRPAAVRAQNFLRRYQYSQ